MLYLNVTDASFVTCRYVVVGPELRSFSSMPLSVCSPPRNQVCVVALPRCSRYAEPSHTFAADLNVAPGWMRKFTLPPVDPR